MNSKNARDFLKMFAYSKNVCNVEKNVHNFIFLNILFDNVGLLFCGKKWPFTFVFYGI